MRGAARFPLWVQAGDVRVAVDRRGVSLICAGWLPQDRFSAGVVRWSNIERGPVSGAHSGFARYSMALPSPVEPRVETKIVTVTPGLCGHHGK